jgi:hypothetical protein
MMLAHDEYKDEKCERAPEKGHWPQYYLCNCAERALLALKDVMLEHKLHLERKDLALAQAQEGIARLKGYRRDNVITMGKQIVDLTLERDALRAQVEKLRLCAHLCLSPCPHTRKYDEEVTSNECHT